MIIGMTFINRDCVSFLLFTCSFISFVSLVTAFVSLMWIRSLSFSLHSHYRIVVFCCCLLFGVVVAVVTKHIY